MTFKEPVVFLRSENTSGPAGMALNCTPRFKFLGKPLLGSAQGLFSANPSYAPVRNA